MGKLNMAAMKSKLEDTQRNSGGGGGFDHLESGKNVRRVLWPKGDKEEFWEEGYVHFGLGPEGKTMVTCPKTHNPKAKCPVCEMVEELKKGSKEDKKLANDIRQVKRIYINVINRDDEESGDEPKILPIGITVLKGLLEAICDPDYGDITDFEDGRDMTIKKSGTGLNTEYSTLPKPKSSVASEVYSEEELEEKMADLSIVFKDQSYDEIVAIMNGDDVDGEDDDDEEDGYDSMSLIQLKAECKSRGIKVSPDVAKSKVKMIALLEEGDEGGGSDDDDDDPSDDEDDDDDGEEAGFEDGDDDDEEEAPKKSSKNDDVKDEIKAALARRKGKK